MKSWIVNDKKPKNTFKTGTDIIENPIRYVLIKTWKLVYLNVNYETYIKKKIKRL